ncbi:LAGLIDADG family homing endonuclease [Methermicoccus shengliensis]|nr:LAGLIDADG family homing endonuclease [Methermicoccus shengliensis]KUK04589.1 MAG: Transcriptional regulator, XRE family [Euryarchaeota archaeon 55_53]MDN5294917.1 replicative helicase Mcm [Methanosarcinales archaeon]
MGASSETRWEEFFHEYYQPKIDELLAHFPEKKSLYVEFGKLESFDPKLADELLLHPESVLRDATAALSKFGHMGKSLKGGHVRIIGLPKSSHYMIKELRSEHIGRLIAVPGLIRKITEVRPRVVRAVFRCDRCDEEIPISQNKPELKEPKVCPREDCGSREFTLLAEKSEFVDTQKLRVQEAPEELEGGEQPQTLDVLCEDDLAGRVYPGDRVVVVGILRIRQRGERERKSPLFDLMLEGNSIEVMEQEFEELEILDEDIKKIKELASHPDISGMITRSIAPSIYGYEDIKEAIALQLFSGVSKLLPDGAHIRGDIHILLVGDPGIAKSQLLRYVKRLAPRGIYTSGKSTTSAGLTATAVKDEFGDGRWTLEAGALVMADKGIAAVDELDKMRPEDRSALHEAMEQQSYHPSFEITLADGSKHKIGEFVDGLFAKFPERKVKGIDCEILRTDDLGIEILTTDFGRVFKTKVDRVSRHKAPDYFVRIKYSNGREILVTPEHPVFVFRDGKITTVEASKGEVGDFAPAVISCEFEGRSELEKHVSGKKEVTLPDSVDECFATSGFASEGYSFAGSSMEVGLSNTNPAVIPEMREAMQKSFGVEPIDYTSVNRTLRLVSKPVYEFMHINFPELMRKSKGKRIPGSILSADVDTRVAFLRAAFMGDGGIESEALCYRTSSRGLAEDYQDLLLTLSIHSRIAVDSSTNSYKVYITGDCVERFVEIVLKDKGQNEKVKWLIERNKRNLRTHDVLPPYVGELIKACLKKLGMKYDGYFHEHLIGNYGVNRIVVGRYIEAIERRIGEIERIDAQSLKELREKLGYSQQRAAELIGVTRSTIDYAERGGYSEEERKTLLQKLRTEIKQVISEVRESLEKIKAMEKFRWLRIKEVEIVPNEGEYRTDWVYDVTVEPTHTFISHGLILHNTVSVAKAGILATLKSRCALLGAANPKLGRFDEFVPIPEQINMAPALLSRFDLIFVMKDRPQRERDERISRHILGTHYAGELIERKKNVADSTIPQEELERALQKIKPDIEPELLRKYIAYARREVFPVMEREAMEELENFYVGLRAEGIDENTPVPVTARQLEALVRLAEASARMRLSHRVTREDARRTIQIVSASLNQVARDPETGKLDADILTVGKSKTQRDKIKILLDIIKELQSQNKEGAPEDEVLQRASEQGIEEGRARELLDKLRIEGEVYRPHLGFYRLVYR